MAFNESLTFVRDLVRLELDCCNLEEFPYEIAQLKHLERFSLTWNECPMEEVFDILSTLPMLRALLFFQTDIGVENPHFLPAAFAGCKNLEKIDFSQRQNLLILPEEIGAFSNLRSLEVANIDYFMGDSALLKSLSESLYDLPNLEKLNVYGCDNLKKLPNAFQRLKHLSWLDTQDSGIHELDFSEVQFRQIITLHMNRQEIEYEKFTALKELSIENAAGFVPVGRDAVPDHPQSFSWRTGLNGIFTELPNLRELRLACSFDHLPDLRPTVLIEIR